MGWSGRAQRPKKRRRGGPVRPRRGIFGLGRHLLGRYPAGPRSKRQCPAIEAVVLATPHTRHRAQVEAAAAARKHVYCEKPFALAKADARAMLDACARAGVTIAVGHHFRLMPSMKALRREVESGALGTIMHAEGNYSHDWLKDLP